MNKKKICYRLATVWYLVPLLLVLFIWHFSTLGSRRLQFLFASPKQIGNALIHYVLKGNMLQDVGITAAETILGFILGNLIGFLLGLSLAYFPPVAKIFKPYMIALGAIPIFALAPMMIMWFGIGFFSKVMMAFFSTFLIAASSAYNGAANVDMNYVQLLRSMGANRRKIFQIVVIPSSFTWIVGSFRLTIGFALLGAFIGEFISSEKGLGHHILRAGGLYDIPQVISGLIFIIIIALVLNYFVNLIEKYLLRWKFMQSDEI